MASFLVSGGVTDPAAKSVSNNDTGTIQAGGTLSDTTDITWTGGTAGPPVSTVIINNSGTITATTRGIDTASAVTTGNFTLNNKANALLTASDDAFRLNFNAASGAAFNGKIDVENVGTIRSTSSGQALDFASVTSQNATIVIDNTSTGIISAQGADAIRPGAGHIQIDNSGLIDSTASANRAINLNAANLTNIISFELDNHAGGIIQSQGDTVRITASTKTVTAAYTVEVDNAGTIQSTGMTGANNGQAIDFNDLVSTSGHVHIINEAGGLISAADADAIRAGVNTTIDNHGHIVSHNAAGDSGDDGIDFQGNGGGLVNNYSDGVIDGARHGITGDLAITINNDGSITGHLGSGINMDTASLSMTTVTNHGTIIGTGGYLGGDPTMPVDGDGIDVDGLLTLHNFGTIQATGVHVELNGMVDLQEAVTIGGGSIINEASGVITSFERAITVNDSDGTGGPGGSNGSNGGNGFAPTTIENWGLIHGGNGEAISITDTFADTISNHGTIEGSVFTGGGDDVFNLYSGSSITGAIDGGDGNDVVNLLGTGTGAVGTLNNVETVNLFGGDWTLGSETGIHSVDFMAAATLRVAANLLTDGHFDATIDGFANVDAIDLGGIGSATDATLGAGGALTVSGGSNGPVTLQFDADQSFDGFVFQVSSDGAGGTMLSLAKLINGGNGDDTLTGTVGNDVINAGNGNDRINSDDGNDTITAGNGDDTIHAGNGNNTLTGGNGNDILTVGNGNNVLHGDNGNDTLRVGIGDNILTGGNGSDAFVFGPVFGKDVITDFSHGDHVEFDGAFANFKAVHAATHQVGADSVITVDADHSVTLLGVSASSLHASDFILV